MYLGVPSGPALCLFDTQTGLANNKMFSGRLEEVEFTGGYENQVLICHR